MDLVEQMHGAVKVVTVRGRIDQSSASLFQEKLAPWLVRATAEEAALLLDFSGVDYISSVGLRVLMLAARQVKAQQGRLAIAALTPVVAEVFQISRFNLVLPVHADVATALANLG
jgi:anti-anti-sigma factor